MSMQILVNRFFINFVFTGYIKTSYSYYLSVLGEKFLGNNLVIKGIYEYIGIN